MSLKCVQRIQGITLQVHAHAHTMQGAVWSVSVTENSGDLRSQLLSCLSGLF